MSLTRPARALTGVVLSGFALAGCGSGSDSPRQPAASSFTEGTCRAAAPDVLSLGRDASTIGRAGRVDAGVRTSLKEAQLRLRDLAVAAEPAYKPALDALVVSTGFVRIRADGNSYDAAVGRQLMADYRTVLKVCTGAGAGSQ
jgi:hypothetical protein